MFAFSFKVCVFVGNRSAPTSKYHLVHPRTVGAYRRSVDPRADTLCAGAQGTRLERVLNPGARKGGQLCLLTCLQPKPRGWSQYNGKGEPDNSKPWIFSFEFSLPQRDL